MNTESFNYNLPESLIAQTPKEDRDHSRLMVVNRGENTTEHKHFYDVIDYLNPGDTLVFNNSKVIPARLFGIKAGTGANIEILLVKKMANHQWEAMAKPGKRLKAGDTVIFGDDLLKAHVLETTEEGYKILQFEYEGIFEELLLELGTMPLPPYITRKATKEDFNRYQTVYCKIDGSVAAPTAGLHFTDELIQKAKDKGINTAFVTLHVGLGTFLPVKMDSIEAHKMHFESYFIDEENATLINETKKNKGRVVAVGTTSIRVLESVADQTGHVQAGSGETDIFIYPGYTFKVIDALITNFHLPKSTLLMLISAFYNRERILDVYEEAVKEKYAFFSYGDAMLIY